MALHNDDRWIADRLNALEPAWTPNVARGSAALHAALERRRAGAWIVAPAAFAAACLLIAALPQGRAVAQAVWARWTIGRLDVVSVDLSRLPLHTHVTTNGAIQEASTVEQATALAGYAPVLPSSGVVQGTPELTVTPPISVGQTVNVSLIRYALRSVGAGDVEVPDVWDGANLRAEIGPMVGADYPGNAEILQVKPIAFYVPVDVALTDFANVMFRSAGVPAREAKAMALAYAIQPAWLLDVGKDEPVRVQELSLANGRALLIEDLSRATGGVERVTILRSTPDRLFAIASPTREATVAIAEALP
jgi:hypothetical protein